MSAHSSLPFWDGPAKFKEAIDQLLGYATWRDTKAALIIFIRGGQPTEIMTKADSTLRTHPSFETDAPDGTTTRRQYVLQSNRDQARLISVALITVVLPAPKGGPSNG